MRINKLIVGKDDFIKWGIQEDEIIVRNQSIIFTGKNGSGKTRTLNLIHEKILNTDIRDISNQGVLSNIPPYVKKVLMKKDLVNKYLESLVIYIKPDQIEEVKSNLKNNSTVSDYNFSTLIEKQPQLHNNNEFDILTQTAIYYFETLPTKLIIEKLNYDDENIGNFKKTKVFQQYKSLNQKFNMLLGKELTYIADKQNIEISLENGAKGLKGIWKLDDRVYNYHELSDGEKTLLTYILLLYLHEQYPYSKSKNSILLIDEPEIHLHPEAQIRLVKGLQELVEPHGQIIISTHSLTIISLFNYENLYLIKNSKIFQPCSSVPQQAVEELISKTNLEDYLSNVIFNVSNWAYDNFLLQCFKHPEIIEESKKSDPQYMLFRETLQKGKLDILDFGSGKGRLEKLIIEDQEILEKINLMDVCEHDVKLHNELKQMKMIRTIFNDIKKIQQKYNVIILSNVLHEISPMKWHTILNKLMFLLKPRGFIVIIEDLELRTGEKPNEFGYLLLNAPELEILLGSTSRSLEFKSEKEQYKERLLCTVFFKENMSKITIKKVKKAIEKLKDRTYRELIKLRTKEDFLGGRKYAFYSQQFINCTYTLSKMNNTVNQ